MAHEIKAMANVSNTADLIIEDNYFVVKGNHYEICNGYITRSQQNKAILIKDILSMEYITIRSKRLLLLFMVLISIIVFGGSGMYKVYSATKQIDKKIQVVQNIYNEFTNEEIDIGATNMEQNATDFIGIKMLIVIYMLLIFCGVGTFYLYLFKPFHFFLVSSLGSTVAVKSKCYEKKKLDEMVALWKMIGN